MIYPVFIPRSLQFFFPRYLFHGRNGVQTLFLTFDDGPVPGATEFVLDELKKYQAKATFFCTGRNVREYPDIFERIVREGHAAGNHTFTHRNAFDSSFQEYVEEIRQTEEEFRKAGYNGDLLFRPPYGRLKPGWAKKIRSEGYKIILWEVMSGDFDEGNTPEKCFGHVRKHAQSGSIVVMHDSRKAMERLEKLLPRLLEHYSNLGYSFESVIC